MASLDSSEVTNFLKEPLQPWRINVMSKRATHLKGIPPQVEFPGPSAPMASNGSLAPEGGSVGGFHRLGQGCDQGRTKKCLATDPSFDRETLCACGEMANAGRQEINRWPIEGQTHPDHQGNEHYRLSEARWQAVLDNTTAVIYIKDTQGRYLLINREFEGLFHVTQAQVIGKTDYDLFPVSMADAFRKNDQKVLETRTPLEFEEVAPRDGQCRTYISIKFPLCDPAGKPCSVCGISTDITERKRAEKKLVEANAELVDMNRELARSEEALRKVLLDLQVSHEELKATQLRLVQAGKMESVGVLAAGVAHEVKNPLQTILMGLAYLSRNTTGDDRNIPMVLGDMRDAVKRADAIVRDLLYLSAARQLDIKAENVNEVIEHSLALVNYELTCARISVVRELAAPVFVPLDKAKLEQVFINLFMNAIHAMAQGGILTVSTAANRWGEMAPTPERISDRFNADDLIVAIQIRDTGVGIPEEKLSKIFEPFFTTKPTGIGTGLGLPITKQIIELHGGHIDIQSACNGGVKVRLMLKAENGGRYE